MSWGALSKRSDVVYQDDAVILICARWQDVVRDLPAVDAVITDPPYSARTHKGHRAGVGRSASKAAGGGVETTRRDISYEGWTPEDVTAAVTAWDSVCRGWIAALTDSDLWAAYRAAFATVGRTSFQPLPAIVPLPCVISAMTVRLSGDGPSSWAVHLMAGRPPQLCKWGTLRGAYGPGGPDRNMIVTGGKPLWLMRAIVGDYSRPGDLVCDPCAGGCTTGVAARLEGRRAILIEMNPETAELAAKRLHPLRGKSRNDDQGELFA